MLNSRLNWMTLVHLYRDIVIDHKTVVEWYKNGFPDETAQTPAASTGSNVYLNDLESCQCVMSTIEELEDDMNSFDVADIGAVLPEA
ncbi:hypothetical protein RvY_11647 [Ramazzottius varieornatus]|uniref:Uncharacterized protein n=1 Tax=Ramazzottius varieornatus TaxID=947166 RepID=A0A1D1VJ80_RAMVA|nr:hypothetical protein RvY_11647 [Ramazzottius varieornatus]